MYVRIIKSDARAREKPCLRCGTSLRKVDGTHCPTCGLSVWLSLNANDNLDWSSPAWLKGLAGGAWVMAGAQVLGLAGYLLAMFFRQYALGAVVFGVYLVVYHGGLLLATRHERRYPDRIGTFRLAAQIVAAAAIFFGVALAGRGASHLAKGWPVPHRPMPASIPAGMSEEEYEDLVGTYMPAAPTSPWLLGAEIMAGVSALATFAYLRKLAQRAGRPGIGRICGWILLFPLLALVRAIPILAIIGIFAVLQLVVYLPLIYYPGTLVLIAWFALQFASSSKCASENWAKESAGAAA